MEEANELIEMVKVMALGSSIIYNSFRFKDELSNKNKKKKKLERIKEEILEVFENLNSNLKTYIKNLMKEYSVYVQTDESKYPCKKLVRNISNIMDELVDDFEKSMGEFLMIFKEDKDLLEENIPENNFKLFNKMSRRLNEQTKTIDIKDILSITLESEVMQEYIGKYKQNVKEDGDKQLFNPEKMEKLRQLTTKIEEKPEKLICVMHINKEYVRKRFSHKLLDKSFETFKEIDAL